MLLHEFLYLTCDFDQLVNYLCDKKVIRKEVVCPRCKKILHFRVNDTNLIFKCTNMYYKIIRGRKRQRKVCNFSLSALHNTWFSHYHLGLQKTCRFIAYFLMLQPPRQIFLQNELGMNPTSVVDWTNFCREVRNYNLLHLLIVI